MEVATGLKCQIEFRYGSLVVCLKLRLAEETVSIQKAVRQSKAKTSVNTVFFACV